MSSPWPTHEAFLADLELLAVSLCPYPKGEAMTDNRACPNCDGEGYIDDEDGNHDCPMCDGTAEVPADFDPVAAGWRVEDGGL